MCASRDIDYVSGACVRVRFGMSSLNVFRGGLYRGRVVPADVRSEREADIPSEDTLLLQSPRPLQAPPLEERKAEFLFLSVSVPLSLVLRGSPRLLAV